MAELEKGITENGTGYVASPGTSWARSTIPRPTDSTFAFETNSDPGQFVPVHIHPTQEELILVQEGTLDLKLDGKWVRAHAGDLVRMRAVFRMATSTNPTSHVALCSGCRPQRSWKRCSRSSTI